MTTTDTDALKECIARVLYSNDFPTHMGGWDRARALAKERYADRAAAVLPVVAAEVRKAKAEAWDEGYLDRSPYGGRAQSRADNPYRETGDSDEHR